MAVTHDVNEDKYVTQQQCQERRSEIELLIIWWQKRHRHCVMKIRRFVWRLRSLHRTSILSMR